MKSGSVASLSGSEGDGRIDSDVRGAERNDPLFAPRADRGDEDDGVAVVGDRNSGVGAPLCARWDDRVSVGVQTAEPGDVFLKLEENLTTLGEKVPMLDERRPHA